jgi:peptide chain release factor 3
METTASAPTDAGIASPAPVSADAELRREAARRRTFAIIAHPDAGKTTLTEKLLLYSGAVELAGAVRKRKSGRAVTSDWMDIERARGISVTSSAVQFEYGGCRFNLLDTPGHQDFSEDTYRTLMATDSAVMVLDAAKGIEPQTRRLFEVCRLRATPILTFINKLDQPGRNPLALLDEIERVLGMPAVPMNWPVGSGPGFHGVYDLRDGSLQRFDRAMQGRRSGMETIAASAGLLARLVGRDEARELQTCIDLVQGTLPAFSPPRFLAAEQTPVFFGSALNNFGVQPFLDALVQLAPPPRPRVSAGGAIPPDADVFSGFVFKIQANMDPQHRDRMAFLRVCSGRFIRDMAVHHARLGRDVRMTRPHRLFGRERELIETAYPGDVVGVINPGLFQVGDTVADRPGLAYEPMPAFQPAHFARLRNVNVGRRKQFDQGLKQLQEEGAVRVLSSSGHGAGAPILAGAGVLQFSIVGSRLASEYGVETVLEPLPHREARWCVDEPLPATLLTSLDFNTLVCTDEHRRSVLLFMGEWDADYCQRRFPDVRFRKLA